MSLSSLIDTIGDWNPQLFREIKGQYKTRNLSIAVLLSIVGQIILFFVFKIKIPVYPKEINRYCIGSPPPDWNGYNPNGNLNTFCNWDLGSLTINWRLWWLDIFITLSIIGMIGLLVAGTYLLIADLSKEENRGTLNFIRLSPQSAKSLFVGKLLGIPSLVYLSALLGVPFHLIAGLNAHLPISLIIGFYGVVIASCVFFFNTALLLGLVTAKLGGFQSFVISGGLFFFLAGMTGIALESHYISETPFDWIILFYPGIALKYLTEASFIHPSLIGYFSIDSLRELQWYGSQLWHNSLIGMGLLIANFALWTYWITQGLKRRFRNPSTPLLTKMQSYGLSLCFIIVLLGFTLQKTDGYKLFENYQMLQLLIVGFTLILIAALTPHRENLQDWSRYRHQMKFDRKSLLKSLLFGEKSPAILAIAVNLSLMILYMIPSLLLFSLRGYRLPIFAGLVLGSNILLIVAIAVQWTLLQKLSKRVLLAFMGVGGLTVAPLMALGFLNINPQGSSILWLSTIIPLVSIENARLIGIAVSLMGQWTVMILGTMGMAKQLQKIGESEGKRLLSSHPLSLT